MDWSRTEHSLRERLILPTTSYLSGNTYVSYGLLSVNRMEHIKSGESIRHEIVVAFCDRGRANSRTAKVVLEVQNSFNKSKFSCGGSYGMVNYRLLNA
jgi:hypothetical protein